MDKRSELIAGLRALADFYENNPAFPLPYDVSQGRPLEVAVIENREFAATVSQLGGRRDKKVSDNLYRVVRQFGAVELQVIANRASVCEAKVVGTETVMVPDPDAPLVEVERDVIEWVCEPVLVVS